uniref:Uncharacterized protein n=1 Tax=Setaria viridis TaxID=4556 RepID=A0A4U6T1A6_SETVI|nr:hypothetical protein SEVIR_9G356301v2 [Setaria viridis]
MTHLAQATHGSPARTASGGHGEEVSGVLDRVHLAVVERDVREPPPRVVAADHPGIRVGAAHRDLAEPPVADDGGHDLARAHDHLAHGRRPAGGSPVVRDAAPRERSPFFVTTKRTQDRPGSRTVSPENGFASRYPSPPWPSPSPLKISQSSQEPWYPAASGKRSAADPGKPKNVPSGSASHGSIGRAWCPVAARHGRQTAAKRTRSTWDGRRRRTAAATLDGRLDDHGDDAGLSVSRAHGHAARARAAAASRRCVMGLALPPAARSAGSGGLIDRANY